MRDVKEVHSAVCRHYPSAFLCEKKVGFWTYGREVKSSVSDLSALCAWERVRTRA